MKATICPFCREVNEDGKAPMLYDVSIYSADGYDAQSKAEKALLFEAGDACVRCTRCLIDALRQIQGILGKKREEKGRRGKR